MRPFLIDFLCSIPLAIGAAIPLLGVLCAPLLALYWMSRDSFFGGQSIGKRALGLRVARLDGEPMTWSTSLQRNIIFAPLVLEMIPGIGALIGPGLLLVLGLAELVLVLTTQRRIGDFLAKTVVVKK